MTLQQILRLQRAFARFLVVLVAVGLLGFNLVNSKANAVGFSPSSLSGLQFWVDFSDLSTITSSGGFVSQVADKSGNGRDLTQPLASNRPAIGVSTKNGMDVLTFDGGDAMESPLWTQAQPVTMFAVVRNSDNSGANRQIIGNQYRQNPTFYKSGNVWRIYAGAEVVSSTAVDNSWHYLGGVANSASSLLRLDGAQIAAGNALYWSWNNTSIAIGNAPDAGNSFGWIGDIAEVFIYNRVLSNSEITQAESYINSKWFLAPTTTTSTTTTTTTTTTLAPTTTVRSVTTTAAPALEIVVNAPASSAPANTGGQAAQPTIAPAAKTVSTTASKSPSVVLQSTATTTTVPVSTTSVVPPAPSIQAVAPGEAAVTVGDKTEPVVVKRADNQVTVTAGKLSATVGSLNKSGSVAALDNDGNVRLKPGDTVRIKLAGFKPGSTVEAWLFSTPQLMGTAKVGTNGVVVGTFTVPKNVPLGSHRIAVVAQTTDGKPATLAVGVMVGNWKKERSITIWLIVLPIVLAIMGALALPATRRRRKNLA